MIFRSGRRNPGGDGADSAWLSSPSGHICSVCGQPLARDLWDMTVWASETTLAYIICLFDETA